MAVGTIGEAYDLGWRVTIRCSWGPRDLMERVRECIHGAELDLLKLVWNVALPLPLGERL